MKSSFLFSTILAFILIILGCKEPVVIPPPTLALNQELIDLKDITSSKTFTFGSKKIGQGTISFKIATDKKWLVSTKPDTTTFTENDSITLKTDIYASDLLEGNNEAILTVTPTINGVLSPAVNIKVQGEFIKTKVSTQATLFDLGKIKGKKELSFVLLKTGKEKADYEIISDQKWLTFTAKKVWRNNNDTVQLAVDPENLKFGELNGNITITPIINNIKQEPFKVTIKSIYDDTKTGTIEGHTLTKDEIWAGNINLNGSIVVPPAFSLTIKAGTKIVVKKLSSPLFIDIQGNIIIEGDKNNIVEFRSNQNNAGNQDWAGFRLSGNVEMNYVHLRDAANGLNFENRAKANYQTKPYILNNILFNNSLIGMYDFNSNFESNLNNLSFKNVQIFCVSLGNSSKIVNIFNSEFLDNLAYIHVHIPVSNSLLNINSSNFAAKKTSALANLEVIAGNKNNKVVSNSCFGLLDTGGFGSNQNTFLNLNPRSFQNEGIGCGFSGVN